METLAALASIPTRAHLLSDTLASLRPQVDRIAVYLNGYEIVPPCVPELADEWIQCSENEGAERKFFWAPEHRGIYLSCDDDIIYPPDYAATMLEALTEHGGIVTAHGRVFLGRPVDVHDVRPGSVGIFHRRIDYGRHVNHGGTGVMAWNAQAVSMRREWALKNMSDMQVAVWAQCANVPMWLIKHEANWLRSPTTEDPQGLFRLSQAQSHRRRNKLLREHGDTRGWRMCEHQGEASAQARG